MLASVVPGLAFCLTSRQVTVSGVSILTDRNSESGLEQLRKLGAGIVGY